MKRRSARPFTVEVKQTRTSRTPLVDATPRSRASQDVWWDIPTVAADRPAEMLFAPVAQAEPAAPEAPARRVLQSLVPMFSIEPETPEADEAASTERLPRVRRAKPALKPGPKPAPKPMSRSVQKPVAEVMAPAPVPAKTAAALGEPAAMPVRPTRLPRQGDTLRAGERWKRRLPRHLW